MSFRLSFAISLAGAIAAAPAAHAQSEPPAPTLAIEAPPERANSINVSPLGIVLGSYNINYERLFGAHGLVLEGGFSYLSDDGDDSKSLGGSLGYRWHWRGRQNSGFLGLAAGMYDGTGEASVETAGGDEESHDVDVRSYYRWPTSASAGSGATASTSPCAREAATATTTSRPAPTTRTRRRRPTRWTIS
jgi:hypothetical protein